MVAILKALIEKLRTFTDEDCVLIYQMGKVGSSSLEKAVKNSIHLHTLYMNGPCNVSDRYLYHGLRGKAHLYLRDSIKRYLIRRRNEIRIIVPVRDPVYRNISMFFQGLSFWMCDYIDRFERETRHADMEWLWAVYEKTFDHEYCETWFYKEIQRFTGIDIFSHTFDKEKGIEIIKNGKYKVLLVRSEDLDSNVQDIMSFAKQEFTLNRINDSGSKWYSCVYEQFKNSMNPSSIHIEKIRHGLISKHFGYEK